MHIFVSYTVHKMVALMTCTWSWRHCFKVLTTCNKTTPSTFTPLFHEVFQLFAPLLRLFRCFPPFWPTKWTMKALNCANRKGDSILSHGSGSQTDKSCRDCKKDDQFAKILAKGKFMDPVLSQGPVRFQKEGFKWAFSCNPHSAYKSTTSHAALILPDFTS